MLVTTHVLRDLAAPVPVPLATLSHREFTSNPDWRRNLISFTSLIYLPDRKRVLCGLTSFDGDLMYEFDPADSSFHCLDYAQIGEPFEIKIHRSLCPWQDGKVLGATACLHQEDQRREAPGGKLFALDPATREYDVLGIPVPHDYIQTIVLDPERQIVYGHTYPIFNWFVFDLAARVTRRVEYLGSIPHIIALADDGGYWATWNNRHHYLFHYAPDTDTITWHHHELPHMKESCSLMYPGAGPIDSMANGGDGFLYIGEANGALDRLDPRTGEIESLGRPVPGETRIAALELGPDGRLWGVAGFCGRCHLFAYDREAGTFEVFGHIVSPDGEPLFIGHDICFAAPNRLFIGETDTAHRAGYLWEVNL